MTDAPSAELLDRYRRDDPGAAEELYGRYAERLIRLARARLSPALAARVDAEDVALSAWRSFFELARGEEIVLRESGDLWRLLARITVRKVCRSARRQRAGCRSVERERPLADEGEVLASEPSPADVAELADELRCVLAPLDAVRRRVVELRLQGYEAEEIAALVGRSARTVRRVLAWLGEELQRRLTGDRDQPDPAAFIEYGEIVLQRQLGQGGMGKVYRASWRGEVVAVKLLPRPLRGHAPIAARFLEEATVLARMRHPGIVAVRGLGKLPDGGHFLVMDLVEGGDLARRLAAGPVSVRDALTWTAEAADAIEYAHAQGVVHCDLKPSNLLLDLAGRVHVTDFGLARTLAVAGQLAGGTPGFMAPEQRHLDGVVSSRTDVHGLGALVFALLTGRSPFADGEPPSLASLRPDVPGEADALCRRCLDADPDRRPASAAQVAAELRSLLQSDVSLR